MAGIYVHVPFCRRRCSYCDFYFVTSHRQVDDYVDAVCKEVALRAHHLAGHEPVQTIYFGGGTPSRLSTDQLERIVTAISNRFGNERVVEVTIEVNPEDPDQAYLDRLRHIGFNRLSIGIQSLEDTDLQFMLRSHSGAQAASFVEMALASGFDSISIDLIFGLPSMSTEQWEGRLRYAVASGAQHVSLYGLTVEPGTLLGKWVRNGQVVEPPESRIEEQFRLADEVMTGHGFEHYEISNFAQHGHRSLHNQSYWDHSNYIGFGPAAHSFWRSEHARRWENVRSLRRYLEDLRADKLPVSSQESLDSETLMREYVLLGLRTDSGVDLDRLRVRYGHVLSQDGWSIISDLSASGKVKRAGDRLLLTVDGFLVADSITSLILREGAITPA